MGAPEPPARVTAVQDSCGHVADRTAITCDFCGPPGSEWRWRHNGTAACWMDLDGIGPWADATARPSEAHVS